MNIKIALLVLVIAAGGLFALSRLTPTPEPPLTLTRSEPTTVMRTGRIEMERPTSGKGEPYLAYENASGSVERVRLLFDELSVCASPSNALPCVAMSATYDVSFGNSLLAVEGNERDGAILVRKLQTIGEGQIPRTPAVGSVFIPWVDAIKLIENCEAESVMQTHALDVYIQLPDGSQVRAVEPSIDEVFHVLDKEGADCPRIPVATE